MEATGYTARGRLISHLDRCGIPFFAGNGGQIWTTLAAINAALKRTRSGCGSRRYLTALASSKR